MRKLSKSQKVVKDIALKAIDYLVENKESCNTYGCELHNEIYNMDYYIIGTYKAKIELEKFGVFEAIEKVIEYEKSNFGEVTTEIHEPERLLNMLAYIIGEEFLSNSETLNSDEFWNNRLDKKAITKIIRELKSELHNFCLSY